MTAPVPPDDPLRGWVDDDLADRLAGEDRLDIDLTAADLVEAEWAGAGWRDRLAADLATPVTLQLAFGAVHGVLVELLSDAVLLGPGAPGPGADGAPGTASRPAVGPPAGRPGLLVAWHAVTAVRRGVRRTAASRVGSGRPRTAAAVLRRWAQDGVPVGVTGQDGRLQRGRLATVTPDCFDVVGEAEDQAADRLPLTVVWRGVALVRREG